ncbi:hypothetical protein [Thalassomonas actiniarum]|uniref:Uncharacterized protein n=1 Tax=Thalassomonas actiniarum TaxID=485447 RepID=A0AAE9YU30_9GAMM|nr:hypothetical protein [Thalassomonas actiniarum]WDE01116.1 hypothetical protein SG35_011040 [Thalassomonas actiniarum]
MNTNAQPTKTTGAHPLAYFFVASGGGVVGTDYATWLNIDPVIGAVIGGVISLFILQLAYHLYTDPEGEIKKTCTEAGAILGVLLGAYITLENSSEDFAWVIGAFVGGAIGAGMGQMAAAIISLAGFTVLFLSQGPVGLAVRTFILNIN